MEGEESFRPQSYSGKWKITTETQRTQRRRMAHHGGTEVTEKKIDIGGFIG
jgi:hypothetical protein